MPIIRDYRADDLEALYDIALRTGNSGADASALFKSPELPSIVYVAPYVAFEPELVVVLEDEAGVAGYCLGTLHTSDFEHMLERRWWPELQERYPLAIDGSHRHWLKGDEDIIRLIHEPPHSPDRITELYPSHLHINLLPRVQGRGSGRKLLDAWQSRAWEFGSVGFHLGVNASNLRAIGFYEACRLNRLLSPSTEEDDGVWFGKQAPR